MYVIEIHFHMSLLFVHIHAGEKKLNTCYFMKTTNISHDQHTVLKMIFTIKNPKSAYFSFTVHKIMIQIHMYSGNCSQ